MKPPQVLESLFSESVQKGAVQEGNIQNIFPLASDASRRKYYRVSTAAHSYVICLDKPSIGEDHLFLQTQRFLKQAGIRVPEIYDFNLAKGYFLEEDLGDSTLLNYSMSFTPKRELKVYKECVDIIVKLQGHSTGERESSFQKLRFDKKKLDSEVDFSIRHFFDFLVGVNVKNWQGEIGEIKKEMSKINSEIAEKEMVLTHRDFHSRNIMIKNDEIVIIDFQDARRGLPQYDLASLLDDCYYELDHANKENIKKYYFSQLSSIVDDQRDYSCFSYFYDLMCIQRVFKALGTFSSIFNLRSDERYLKYIAFSFEKLKKIMWKYEEFNRLKKFLSLIYYEN